MGNYLFCGDSQKFLEQLKRHLNTGEILKSCTILKGYHFQSLIICYIQKEKETTFYREIDIDELRLFSCSIKLDEKGKVTEYDKNLINEMPPTEYMKESLTKMDML